MIVMMIVNWLFANIATCMISSCKYTNKYFHEAVYKPLSIQICICMYKCLNYIVRTQFKSMNEQKLPLIVMFIIIHYCRFISNLLNSICRLFKYIFHAFTHHFFHLFLHSYIHVFFILLFSYCIVFIPCSFFFFVPTGTISANDR